MPHAGREELNNPSITEHNQSRNEQNYNQRYEEHRHVEVLANICANNRHHEASNGRTHGEKTLQSALRLVSTNLGK